MKTDDITSWRDLIGVAMDRAGDSWDNVVGHTFKQGEIDKDHCPRETWTLWTVDRVYVPIGVDGIVLSVASFPRNP